MQGGERPELVLPEGREADPDHPSIAGDRSFPDHKASGDRAIDQLDHAVVPQEQVIGDVADRRTMRMLVTADREQELMLRRGQSSSRRLIRAPTQEPSQAVAEPEELGVLVVPDPSRHSNIASGYIVCPRCDVMCERRAAMGNKNTEKRPRFSRGQEREGQTPEKRVRPDFARGQERLTPTQHKGEFAAGQERELHHPEDEFEGRFSRGQEATPEK